MEKIVALAFPNLKMRRLHPDAVYTYWSTMASPNFICPNFIW